MAETVKLGTHPDRVEFLLDEIAQGVRSQDASMVNLQGQTLSAQLAQTQALVNGLSNQTQTLSNLLQQQTTLLEQLKTTYSETLIQKITTTGARTIPMNIIPNTYQTFELVALDVFYQCDSTTGQRYITLERFVASGMGLNEFPEAYLTPGTRVVGSSWQNAVLDANNNRNMSWIKDSGNDGFTRVPIPQFPLNVASGMRWRVRVTDHVGPGDTCTALYQLRVFKA